MEHQTWRRSKHVPLEALLRRMSRLAAQILMADGECPPLWLVESPKRELVIGSPIPDGTDQNLYKRVLTNGMREFFREHGVARYVFAAESWTLGDGVAEDEMRACKDLSTHPLRREVIHLHAEDGTHILGALRVINRMADGKPHLSKLEIYRPQEAGGRFMGLLDAAAAMPRWIH
jgi:hypothetical protein